MSDLYSTVTPQRPQPILPSSNTYFPVTPTETNQYARKGNSVVPASLEGQPIPANKIAKSPEFPFTLKKELTVNDVNLKNGLSLQSNWMDRYILQSMDLHHAELIRTGAGKEFPVVDMNDGSLHSLFLKTWKNGCFALAGNWATDFVTRKHLEAGDWIGIAFVNGCFYFKLLKKGGR